VALLALILQLGLAFGHVHGLHAVGPVPIATADAGNAAPSPTNDDDHHDSNYCAIYAILALLTGAQTASAPVVVLPISLTSAEITFAPEAARIASQRAPFLSRAPPVS
jgi:hypothetical protein